MESAHEQQALQSLGLDIAQESAAVQDYLIERVKILKLHGVFDYELEMLAADDPYFPDSRVILLYGDNGAGKTTILNLIFHLLSPAPKRSHRTFLLRTQFQEVGVYFSNGNSIRAVRDAERTVGSYAIHIYDGVFSSSFPVSSEDGESVSEDTELDELEERLESYGIYPYYLADDRTFSSDTLVDRDVELNAIRSEVYWRNRRSRHLDLFGEEVDRGARASRLRRQNTELLTAISRLETWLRRQALDGAKAGQRSSSAIYLDVLGALLRETPNEGDELSASDHSTVDRLTALAERADRFTDFGLWTNFPASSFIDLLQEAPEERRRSLEQALRPYLESSEAQLNALQPLYELITKFTSHINDMMSGKRLVYNSAYRGFDILTDDGVTLLPTELSSGERQLLLLLANTILAREHSKLFIIDEPELSLNVKWQRKLMDVLEDCTAGSNLQFIIATHSIEIMAKRRTSLRKLAPQ